MRAGRLRQREQFLLIEGGDDQQDGVGAVRPGLDDLEFIDDEILAQAGKRSGRRCLAQVVERALEKLLVGQDGKCGGAGLLAVRGPERRG